MSRRRVASALRSPNAPAQVERLLGLLRQASQLRDGWLGLLRQASQLRDGWLGHALSTASADRAAAEGAIADLYRLVGARPPQYEWVDSPAAGPAGEWPSGQFDALPARLATMQFRLRERLGPPQWIRRPPQPPEEQLAAHVPFTDVLDSTVLTPFQDTIADGVRRPIHAAIGRRSRPLTWYGQHDAGWIAGLDVRHRLGRPPLPHDDARQLGLWATLARSCGWWAPAGRQRFRRTRRAPPPLRPHGPGRHRRPDRRRGLVVRAQRRTVRHTPTTNVKVMPQMEIHTTLADLTARTGLDVLDHLELDAAVPVLAGLQAQGDLVVVPLGMVTGTGPDKVQLANLPVWRAVPPGGLELLRGAAGGNAHTLVADAGTCRWTTDVWDSTGLALGVLAASAPVYLLHREHGASGVAAGTYIIRRQRESGPGRDGVWDRLVAD